MSASYFPNSTVRRLGLPLSSLFLCVQRKARSVGVAIVEIMNAFLDVCINGMVGLGEISGIEECLPHVFGVIAADGSRKDRQKVIDSHFGGLHQSGVVQGGMHEACMDKTPTIAEPIGVITFDKEAFSGLILKNRDCVVSSFDEKIDR